MRRALLGTKTALLLSNGVSHSHFDTIQKSIIENGGATSVVATNGQLLRGWGLKEWAQHIAVDALLDEALGIDYDFLVIPGGRRSIEKLRLHDHTKRFLGSFFESKRPVVVVEDALELLIHTQCVDGYEVAGPDVLKESALQCGARWSSESVICSGNLMSGNLSQDNEETFLLAMRDHLKVLAQARLVA